MGTSKEPAAVMSLPVVPPEQAWGAAPAFTFVLILFSLGVEVRLSRWMNIWPGLIYLWILGTCHWLIFLPFTHIPVGHFTWIKQTQDSFRANLKIRFRLWCWVRSMNVDPKISLKLLTQEWANCFPCSCWWGRGQRARGNPSESLSTPIFV